MEPRDETKGLERALSLCGAPAAAPPPPPAPPQPDKLPAPDPKLATKIRGELADRTKRRGAVRSPLRPTVLLAPANHAAVQTLSDRHVARLESLRDAATAAYAKALDSVVLGPETIDSGAYDKAVAAAKVQLAKDLAAAMVKHAQDTKGDLAAVRKTADPQLAGYLDSISASYAKAPPAELPVAFWPTTNTLP